MPLTKKEPAFEIGGLFLVFGQCAQAVATATTRGLHEASYNVHHLPVPGKTMWWLDTHSMCVSANIALVPLPLVVRWLL